MISFQHQTTRLSRTLLLLTIAGASALAQDAPKGAGRGDAAAIAAMPSDVRTAPADPTQAQFIADTEKLSKLTKELRAELAKSNKDTLSLAVVKKAEEVEKLARSLKERMNKVQ